ncbi:probable glycosyltransferase At5g03795 [Diospyros lotus]|uniref:probable glycosyltransferase At5g03795 n=1 Tax=Diospyros lotus TaxID=55363 RepID=UPI00225B0BF0|nr:probable glycosyltransferase At5g03795 [Diospyros lotus]
MGDCVEDFSLRCSSSSSFSKLWRFIIPLILVVGLVVPWGGKKSNWAFTSPSSPWPWRSTSQAPILLASTMDKTSRSNRKAINLNPQKPEKEEEERLNVGKSGSYFVPSMVENTPFPIRSARSQKSHGNVLESLEAGLVQARTAIREAKNGNQTQKDPEYVPVGPIYWNTKAFHRSYLEMEKHFKVYVYEEGEPPVFHYGLSKGILGLEGIFIHNMEMSQFKTRDPKKAHVFFLPFSVISLTHYVYEVDSHAWDPMKNTVRDYVNVIQRKHPFWNRSRGADHFMLACHDWGPEISFGVPYLYKNSIRALCNANTSERFNPSKDVSIPEIYLPEGNTEGLLGGPSPSKRPILVFFAGGVHGPIRPILLSHWQDKDPDVQVHEYLPKGVSYYGMMRKSKFCICPSGYEVASPRMVEALYMGCVPVLIKDHYVKPFSDVLNWKTFSVEVAVKEIPNMKKILEGISQPQYLRMQRRGLQVRRHFEVNLPPKRFDVFHMILHSIWLRRLNIRVYETEKP